MLDSGPHALSAIGGLVERGFRANHYLFPVGHGGQTSSFPDSRLWWATSLMEWLQRNALCIRKNVLVHLPQVSVPLPPTLGEITPTQWKSLDSEGIGTSQELLMTGDTHAPLVPCVPMPCHPLPPRVGQVWQTSPHEALEIISCLEDA